jgi:hypothetical protein
MKYLIVEEGTSLLPTAISLNSAVCNITLHM